MFDVFKKDFIPEKKDFKSKMKKKIESFGFKWVRRNTVRNANSLAQEFVMNDLFGFWIVMTLNNDMSKATIRFNVSYKSAGLFSIVPDVYKFFSLNTPGKNGTTDGHSQIACEGIKTEEEFYQTVYKELDKLPSKIEELRDGLTKNVNSLIENKNEKVVLRIFGPGLNKKLIMKTIEITANNRVILAEIMDDTFFLPDSVKDIFIF